MGKKKDEPKQEPKDKAFVTVKLKDRMAAVPEVKDGKVGDLTVVEYLTNLPESKLVEQVITIGRQFREFKDYFAERVEWIHELRMRLPARGHACKIRLVDADGNDKLLTWSQFCLEVFGVSARWVSKLTANYVGMRNQPDIDEPEMPEGEKPKNETPLAEARRYLEQTENELDTVRTQTSNLRHELGNLLSKIEDMKNGKITADELYRAADACRFRVVPPQLPGREFVVDEKVGTDELLEQLEKATAKK